MTISHFQKFILFLEYFHGNIIECVQSSRGMTFSPTHAPGTRQLLLTSFLGVPVCIKKVTIPKLDE